MLASCDKLSLWPDCMPARCHSQKPDVRLSVYGRCLHRSACKSRLRPITFDMARYADVVRALAWVIVASWTRSCWDLLCVAGPQHDPSYGVAFLLSRL